MRCIPSPTCSKLMDRTDLFLLALLLALLATKGVEYPKTDRFQRFFFQSTGPTFLQVELNK